MTNYKDYRKSPSAELQNIQRGFTLIEMVVTLSIIAILAVVITTQFSGDAAKATKILQTAETIRKAHLRYKMDTGLPPCDIESLWNPSLPTYGSDCVGTSASWNGPYTEKFDVTSTGYYFVTSVGNLPFAGLNPSRGQRRYHFIVVPYINESIARELMKQCSGNPSMGHWGDSTGMANWADGRCYMEDWGGEPGPFALFYLIETTP